MVNYLENEAFSIEVYAQQNTEIPQNKVALSTQQLQHADSIKQGNVAKHGGTGGLSSLVGLR